MLVIKCVKKFKEDDNHNRKYYDYPPYKVYNSVSINCDLVSFEKILNALGFEKIYRSYAIRYTNSKWCGEYVLRVYNDDPEFGEEIYLYEIDDV